MKTILFQGDSITDCSRYRNATEKKQSVTAFFRDGKLFKKITALGEGYPATVSAELESKFPGEFKFYNRGVGGDRIPDVYARIVKDIIKLKPDYMSLLVGVNDIWRNFDDNGCGTGKQRFEKVYNILLEELRQELPELKIIIIGPFVLEGTATANRQNQPNRYSEFRSGVVELALITKKLAEKHGCAYIDLQSVFDEAVKDTVAKDLLVDGVHPTKTGHSLIAQEWLRTFENLEQQ